MSHTQLRPRFFVGYGGGVFQNGMGVAVFSGEHGTSQWCTQRRPPRSQRAGSQHCCPFLSWTHLDLSEVEGASQVAGFNMVFP